MKLLKKFDVEKRRGTRVSCSLKVKTRVGEYFEDEITIEDISSTGAKCTCPPDTIIPDKFELIGLLDDVAVPCKTVWRSKNQIGVEFLSTIEVEKS